MRVRFESYKDCLFNNKIILKKQQIFKSDYHEMYTGEVNKIALRNYKHVIGLRHICTERMLLKCVRVKC